METRSITEMDRVVGGNMRRYRLYQKKSQGELGRVIGVTFQQIQKYERAENRISAGKLHEIAVYLQIPIQDFFI